MTIVAKTKVVHKDDEYIVRAYGADGGRLPDCDYYTDNADDAYVTASYMLDGLTVHSVWAAYAYRQVNSEEGAYYAIAGHNVFVDLIDADGSVHVFVYGGPDNGGARYVFSDGAELDAFVARVKATARIKAAAYWLPVEVRDPNELPDYVVNPHRPEYN